MPAENDKSTFMVSLSNHEGLILRQAQDEDF
jgi:hypothetical protein